MGRFSRSSKLRSRWPWPLATRVAELLSIDPAITDTLLQPRLEVHTELGPFNRLIVLGPLLIDNNGPLFDGPTKVEAGLGNNLNVTVPTSSDNVVGVETAYYAFRSADGKPGMRIEFLSADDRVGGQTTHPYKPSLNFVQLSPDAYYYRVFLETALSQSNHRTALLAASSRRETAEAIGCVPHSVFSSALVVTINGAETIVQGSWSVRAAIRQAGGQPEAALTTLKIKKYFAGKLVPVVFANTDSTVLDLPLTGGEQFAGESV